MIEINQQQLYKESAQILETLQQLTEAAEMYERAGQYERAASIYIQTKNFTAATPLMAKVGCSVAKPSCACISLCTSTLRM